MLLNIGVSGTKATDEDYDELIDWLPNVDDNDGLENVVVENYGDLNNNELLSVNFNSDVSEIAINDILNEMRMGSPIENDLLNDLLPDEPTNNFHQPDNGDLENCNISLHQSSDYNFDQNNTFNEQNAENVTNDDWLDQLLNPDPCSMPDVQVNFDDAIQFRYDASEQINWEPDISLPNVEESNDETVAVQYNNGFNMDVGIKNDYDLKCKITPFLMGLKNHTVEKHHCSTTLPMMPKELYEDIKNYLKSEQIHNYGLFSEFLEMFRDLADRQDDDKVNFKYDNETLPEVVDKQDQLFQNSNDSFGVPTVTLKHTTNKYNMNKCNKCVYCANSLHGLSVHMRVHATERFNCSSCKFKTSKEHHLKRHQMLGHGKAYICEMCKFVTQSSSKMRTHMRKKH